MIVYVVLIKTLIEWRKLFNTMYYKCFLLSAVLVSPFHDYEGVKSKENPELTVSRNISVCHLVHRQLADPHPAQCCLQRLYLFRLL